MARAVLIVVLVAIVGGCRAEPATSAVRVSTPPVIFEGEEIERFRGARLAPGGAHAYAEVNVQDAYDCATGPAEKLVVVDMVNASAGAVTAVGAGLIQYGEVVDIAFRDGTDAAVLFTCSIGTGVPYAWLYGVRLNDEGRIAEIGPHIDLTVDQNPQVSPVRHLVGWVSDDVIRTWGTISTQGSEPHQIEHQDINVWTGQLVASEEYPSSTSADDPSWVEDIQLTPDGHLAMLVTIYDGLGGSKIEFIRTDLATLNN